MLEKKDSTQEMIDGMIARYKRIMKAATVMTADEKAALQQWEKENVTGNGDVTTSDWPGWDSIINRISH
ncbi:hypothetical protein D9M69_452350 [compost metagenome]